MRSFRHPRWQHLDYRVKVATTQENKPPTQGTRQWTFTTPRWRCGSILLPSLNAGVPEPTGGECCGDNGPSYNEINGVSQAAAIAGAIILLPSPVVNSLRLISGSSTQRFHLRPPGGYLNIKSRLTGVGIPIIKIRWSHDSYLYNENPHTWIDRLYIETGP